MVMNKYMLLVQAGVMNKYFLLVPDTWGDEQIPVSWARQFTRHSKVETRHHVDGLGHRTALMFLGVDFLVFTIVLCLT